MIFWLNLQLIFLFDLSMQLPISTSLSKTSKSFLSGFILMNVHPRSFSNFSCLFILSYSSLSKRPSLSISIVNLCLGKQKWSLSFKTKYCSIIYSCENTFIILESIDCSLVNIGSCWLIPSLVLNLTAAVVLFLYY